MALINGQPNDNPTKISELTNDSNFITQEELNLQISNIDNEITQLKTSVSNGKTSIASAITGKGVSTSNTATFDTMANNIQKIETGVKWYITMTDSQSAWINFYLPASLAESTHTYLVGVRNHNSVSYGYILEDVRLANYLGWSGAYNAASVPGKMVQLSGSDINILINWANNYTSYTYSSASWGCNIGDNGNYYSFNWQSGSYRGPHLLFGLIK